jgi:hypothetical protein
MAIASAPRELTQGDDYFGGETELRLFVERSGSARFLSVAFPAGIPMRAGTNALWPPLTTRINVLAYRCISRYGVQPGVGN